PPSQGADSLRSCGNSLDPIRSLVGRTHHRGDQRDLALSGGLTVSCADPLGPVCLAESGPASRGVGRLSSAVRRGGRARPGGSCALASPYFDSPFVWGADLPAGAACLFLACCCS